MYVHSIMAHKTQSSVSPSGASWAGQADATPREASPLVSPTSDEEEGVEEPWTSKSLSPSFIWIETGTSPSLTFQQPLNPPQQSSATSSSPASTGPSRHRRMPSS